MTPTLLIPAVLILLALVLVMPALWGRRGKSTDAAERSRFVYQSRLQEIEQELKSETLGLAQSQQARRELERDVLAHMGFRPLIRDLRLMDAGLFQPAWGGLAAALAGA